MHHTESDRDAKASVTFHYNACGIGIRRFNEVVKVGRRSILEVLGLHFEDLPAGKAGGSVPRTITSSDLDFFEEMTLWPKCETPEGRAVPEAL